MNINLVKSFFDKNTIMVHNQDDGSCWIRINNKGIYVVDTHSIIHNIKANPFIRALNSFNIIGMDIL